MKKFKSMVLIGCAIAANLALAEEAGFTDGANGSGGGSQLAAAFHLRAQKLIDSISQEESAEALCSPATMNQALGETKIRIVKKLIDPKTHKPITDDKLDAYTSPGDMQLLGEKWELYLNGPRDPWARPVGSRRSIEVLILHEVYRATKGKCDDESYKISDKIPFFLTRPNKLSKVLKFTTQLEKSRFYPDRNATNFTCERGMANSSKDVLCSQVLYRGYSWNVDTWFVVTSERFLRPDWSDKVIADESEGKISIRISEQMYTRVRALLSTTSPDRPLFVVVDDQGIVSVGISFDRLFALN